MKIIMTRFVFIAVLCLLQPQHALSQEDDGSCTAESAVLNTNSDVSAAVSGLQSEATEVLQNFSDFCSIFKRSCSADLSTLDSATELQTACTAQGGKIVERDVGLKCTGSLLGIPIPGGFTVETKHFPACVGASCDGTMLPAEVEAVFGSVLDRAEKEIENALGNGVDCIQPTPSGAWSRSSSSCLLLLVGVMSTMWMVL
jgi:hypothetical protein